MDPKTKMIATDLDGTLLDNDKNVPEGFEDFVLQHPELRFVIASGRQYFNIIELFPKAKDKMTFIAENGGLIYSDGEAIHKDAMTPEDVRACIDTYNDPKICCLILCGVKSAYMLKTSSQGAFDNSYKYYKKLEFVDSFDNIDDDIIKIAVYVEGDRADEYYHEIEPINSRLDYLLSGVCWIDIANKTVSKGAAMKVLQDRYGITEAETMAFGDYLNDESLLKAAGQSYAMANSHPELFVVACFRAPSNMDNGVMKVLEDRFGNKC